MKINSEELVKDEKANTLAGVFGMTEEEGETLDSRITTALSSFNGVGGSIQEICTYAIKEVKPQTEAELFLLGLMLGAGLVESKED